MAPFNKTLVQHYVTNVAYVTYVARDHNRSFNQEGVYHTLICQETPRDSSPSDFLRQCAPHNYVMHTPTII